jgi:succinate dehydrogenase / fumarate reductase, flavoprotein subunit
LPYTIGDYLANEIISPKIDTNAPEFDEAEKDVVDRLEKLYNIKGKEPVDHFHKKLGHIMWDYVGMSRKRNRAEKGIAEMKAFKKNSGPMFVFQAKCTTLTPNWKKQAV